MNIGPLASLAHHDSDYERLLGRAILRPDLEPLRPSFAGMSVLVTGAAGSIGAELCAQLLQLDVGSLVCVDHDETALFHLDRRLSRRNASVHCCVDDVADAERMHSLLAAHHVNAVFHAAAYKHVPLMERHPGTALKNNVFSLAHLLEVAENAGVQSFLLISTDKAVNPVNVMGATKRIGELLLSARPAQPMRCMSVRFGNVLDSQGSVLPIFREQLRKGEALSVTDPEITRYFMTIHEATSLLLQAFAIANPGDTLVLTVGASIRILRLAEALLRVSGVPVASSSIVFSGLRPGEKLHEELFYERERPLPTVWENVFRAQSQAPALATLPPPLRKLETLAACGNATDMRRVMAEIVPEYHFDLADEELSAVALGGKPAGWVSSS